MQTLSRTRFRFSGQSGFYRGKVRDIYFFGDKVAMVATDRISAFDALFPRPIPDKGRTLNLLAAHHLQATATLAPNWLIAVPDPNVTIGYRCDVFPIEVVVRGYLAGHAWRVYRDGRRTLCGEPLPDGLAENDPLPHPIITPTTKAVTGDRDISRDEILRRRLVGEADYAQVESYALTLYKKGVEMAAERGLLLVDTKYEFGKRGDDVCLVDEVHTPDSSRYFYRSGYEERQQRGQPQRHLSKEFVRQWLIQKGFQGKPGQLAPAMTDSDTEKIAQRYRELYRQIIGHPLPSAPPGDVKARIRKNIANFMRLR